MLRSAALLISSVLKVATLLIKASGSFQKSQNKICSCFLPTSDVAPLDVISRLQFRQIERSNSFSLGTPILPGRLASSRVVASHSTKNLQLHALGSFDSVQADTME